VTPPAFAHPLNASVIAYLAEGAKPRTAAGRPAWDLDGSVLRTHPDPSEALLESVGPRAREFAGAGERAFAWAPTVRR